MGRRQRIIKTKKERFVLRIDKASHRTSVYAECTYHLHGTRTKAIYVGVCACVRACGRASVCVSVRVQHDTAKTKRTPVTVHCVGRRCNRGNGVFRCCLQTHSGRRRSVPPSAPLATVDRNGSARKHIFQTCQSSTIWGEPHIHDPSLQRKRNQFVLRCGYSFQFGSPKI